MMPGFTIEATIRASARFTLHIEAEDESAARAWARDLLDPRGLLVDDALHEYPLDTDDGSVALGSVERSDFPIGTGVVATGVPGDGEWNRVDG